MPRCTAASEKAWLRRLARSSVALIMATARRPRWSPRDYAAFAREGFMQNAIVYRSVRMIAEAAASVPLCLYDGPHEIEEHPLLRLIERPTPTSTRAEFFETLIGFLLEGAGAVVDVLELFELLAVEDHVGLDHFAGLRISDIVRLTTRWRGCAYHRIRWKPSKACWAGF